MILNFAEVRELIEYVFRLRVNNEVIKLDSSTFTNNSAQKEDTNLMEHQIL